MGAGFRSLPLTPALGAEIDGADISQLDDGDFDALHQVFLERKLLILRDQAVDLEQLLRFSRRFGELMRLPYITPHDGYPDIIRVLKQAEETDMGVFGGEWHSDFSFLAAPPKISILLCEQNPPSGGDTLWADMSAALAALPRELREFLPGKIAIHTGKPYGVTHAPDAGSRFRGSIEIERNQPAADRETRHPVICRHPETGQEMLFVNPTYTTRIDGLPAEQSDDLLDRLYRHCTRPEFGCRFRWSAGCLAIWDNRNTMHYAVNDYDGYRRCLYRTTIAGDAPLSA